jgi:pilus assembly protein Flp/PilA
MLLASRRSRMNRYILRFLKDETGATAIEYGLIAALVAVVIISGASALGNALNNTFKNVATKVANPSAAS